MLCLPTSVTCSVDCGDKLVSRQPTSDHSTRSIRTIITVLKIPGHERFVMVLCRFRLCLERFDAMVKKVLIELFCRQGTFKQLFNNFTL